MCYYTQQGKTAGQLSDFYNRNVDDPGNVVPSAFINGFSFPNLPIVLDSRPELITTSFTWGLVPTNREADFRKSTLNARVETLADKVSFAPSINKRCLVIVSAYFDWHWNDPAGKSKTKYEIHSAVDEIFYLAGIYHSWQDAQGAVWNTYSIVTTEANDLMRYVHNRKEAEGDQRMPIHILKNDEQAWLDANHHPMEFAYPNYNPALISF